MMWRGGLNVSDTLEFEAGLGLIWVDEGGYVNRPDDPGHATNFGITQSTFDEYCDRLGIEHYSVRALTREVARQIYKHYWDMVAESLSAYPGLALQVFDVTVNSGRRVAVELLQRAVGVDDDGEVGPVTMKALTSACSTEEGERLVAISYRNNRIGFYHGLNKPQFLRGWINRANRVEAEALKLTAMKYAVAA